MYLTGKADYLILFSHDDHKGQLRCVVRKVRLRPLGNFMMGLTTLFWKVGQAGKIKLSLSGSAGRDGFPIDADKWPKAEVWDKLHPIPDSVAQKYWNDSSGWNDVGTEARKELHAWAYPRLRMLRCEITVNHLFDYVRASMPTSNQSSMYTMAQALIKQRKKWAHLILDPMEDTTWFTTLNK